MYRWNDLESSKNSKEKKMKKKHDHQMYQKEKRPPTKSNLKGGEQRTGKEKNGN